MSNNENNPLQPIIDAGREDLKKIDDLGYAEIFKKTTENLFKSIKDFMKEKSQTFNPIDITYLDSYFIFSRGTNSIVHFHIEECKSWKFGIWWHIPETKENKEKPNYIIGDFFAQFEETIDKFKPSGSIICVDEFHALIDEKSNDAAFNIGKEIKFIIDEPYLAFCRDYYYWDYNTQYHSREEAKKEYENYVEHRDKEKRISTELTKKMLDWAEETILPLFINSKIFDRGNGWSPRYIIGFPYEENKEFVDLFINTRIFFDDVEVIYDNNKKFTIGELFDKIKKECKDIAKKEKIYWNSPLAEYFTIRRS